ncbi:MAG: hypothetical protein NUW24_01405 [Anaerolineae bacterium]|jgi:hypothetical protein|nr:hypothetical protein [Anaerolineae bacterium]MDH7475105.1 hypothetical protein [Anaerolineae bacterium]
MPTCLSCKREYLTGHFYCRHCGTDNTAWFAQHNRCPRCGADLKPENALKARCPQPGCKAEAVISYQELPDGRLLCRKCGADNTDHFIKSGICPRCGAERADWNLDNARCPVCKAGGTIAYHKENICPFCGADNSGARALSAQGGGDRLRRFFLNFPGVLALIFALAPLVSPFARRSLGPYISIGVSTVLAVFLSCLIVFFSYSLKGKLRDYSWGRRVKKGLRPSPILIMIAALVAALALALVFIATYKDEGYSRLLNSLMYSGIFIFFSLAFALGAAQQYAAYLDGTMQLPEPVFAHEDRLVRVITKSAQRKLGDKTPLRLLEMERRPTSGVVILFAHYGDPEYKPTGDGKNTITVREERKWKVVADEWGNILSIREEGLPKLTEVKPPKETALQKVEG